MDGKRIVLLSMSLNYVPYHLQQELSPKGVVQRGNDRKRALRYAVSCKIYSFSQEDIKVLESYGGGEDNQLEGKYKIIIRWMLVCIVVLAIFNQIGWTLFFL